LLSGVTVEKALAYVRDAGGRVTFFHAQPDYAATPDGVLMHAMAPQALRQASAGNARALLAKTTAAARAAGVACDAVAVVSDHPHEAIADAAAQKACGLILMASHGRRGWKGTLLGSVTQKVLQRSAVLVLVAAVESNLPLSDEQRAVATNETSTARWPL
jgi:nucleotide-binding universal stress UspA family protein